MSTKMYHCNNSHYPLLPIRFTLKFYFTYCRSYRNRKVCMRVLIKANTTVICTSTKLNKAQRVKNLVKLCEFKKFYTFPAFDLLFQSLFLLFLIKELIVLFFYLPSLQLMLCRVAAVKRLPVHQPQCAVYILFLVL